MSDYKKLRVWRKAHALAINAHRTATRFRGAHYTALRSQIIRSAMSVPANIVEGREQASEAAFARFLRISLASTSELEYHLLAARDMGILPSVEHRALASQVVEVRMMLQGLLRRLSQSKSQPDTATTGVKEPSAHSE